MKRDLTNTLSFSKNNKSFRNHNQQVPKCMNNQKSSLAFEFPNQTILNHKISNHKHQILSHKPGSAGLKAKQPKFLQKMRKRMSWNDAYLAPHFSGVDRAVLSQHHFSPMRYKRWHRVLPTLFRWWHRFLPTT